MTASYVAGHLTALILKYIQQAKLNVPDITAELLRANTSKGLPYQQWCLFLDELVTLSGEPALGIKLGALVDPNHYGVLGHLALSCETAGEALLHFERYQKLLYGGDQTQAGIEGLGNKLKFTWPIPKQDLIGSCYSDEMLISGLIHFVRCMTGREDLGPVEVGFRHADPTSSTQQFAAFYGILKCPVRFEQPNISVTVNRQYLNLPIATHDSALQSLLDQQARALISVLPNNEEFEKKIKRLLVKSMQEGQPSLHALANHMNTSPRTLHRKLVDRGTNFKTLLENTRKELALQYLQANRLSMSEIALLLGYSEQSDFSRAFKQWTGHSPKHYLGH